MLRLKQELSDHGISQAELARLVGVSPATIAQLLNHGQWPKSPEPCMFQLQIQNALIAKGMCTLDSYFKSIPAASTAGMEDENTKTTLTREVADMLLRKQTLSQKAKTQFGLFKDPFTDDVQDPADLYLTPDARAVREYLWSTARFGGFLAVVGESGAGKSTLREDLEERINREYSPDVVMMPYVLGMEDNDQQGKPLKAAAIADAMIRALAPLEHPRQSMEAKAAQLHKLLKDSRRGGNSHVLVIEEAHGLHKQTLKHLKRFIELKDGMKSLLGVILIGQTELAMKLSQSAADVREVVQRCELVQLPPLDAHLEGYIRFKLQRVGADVATIFAADAMDAIRAKLLIAKTHGKTRDIISVMYPLMVNNLITAALNQAASLGFDKIDADLIREVA